MIKIAGKVIKGKEKGKKLGFPTANLELQKKIESGVYKGVVEAEGENYKAGIFISRNGKKLEAHLIGFAGNLAGKEIKVEIHNKIRNVIEFNNDEDLKKQIEKDIAVISNS